MLKFTIDFKDFKPIIEKVTMVIDKKSLMPAPRRIYFQTTDCRKLRVYGTDFSHFLEVECDAVHGIECGRIGIDADDLKILTKMAGDVTVTETVVEGKPAVTVRNRKKCVTLPACFEEGMDLPAMEDVAPAMLIDGSWLLETVSKLSCFTTDGKLNPLLGSICLNTREKQAEALDSQHAGIRAFPEDAYIYRDGEIKLPHQSFPLLKMLLDKKPGKEVLIFKDEKYVKIAGTDFTYVVRGIEGKFFDLKQILAKGACCTPYRITAGREEFMKVLQYGSSLVGKKKVPIILNGADGRLFTYLNTGRYEILDELSTGEAELPEDFFISFFLCQLQNILKVMNGETVELYMESDRLNVYAKEGEYSFLICPTRIKPEDKEAVKKLILAGRADSRP